MVAASRPDARAASVPAEARRARVVPGGAAGFAPRDILGNIGWLLAAQAIAGGGQFALSVLLARHLGAETYGQWTFAFAFVALCAVLADFGFSTLAVRDLARDPTVAPRYLGNVLAIKVVISILLFGGMAAVAPLINRDRVVLTLVLLLGGQMVLTSFSQLLFSTFRAQGRTQFEAAARGLQALLLLGLAFVLASRGAGVQAFGWAALATAGAGLVFTGALVVRWFTRPELRVDLSFCRSLLREALPLALGLACTGVYYYADAIMLGVMRPHQEVGWYGAAYALVLGIALLIGSVRNAFFPAQSRSLLGERDVHTRLLRQYARLTAMLALPIAFAGPLAARALVELLYGSSFALATNALRLLFVMTGVMFFSSYFGSELLAAGRQRVYLVGVAVGAALNLVLNAVLIPELGLEGAAAATLGSESAVCVFMWWQTRELGVPVGDLVISASGAASLAGAVLLVGLLVAPLVLAMAAAAIAYAVALGLWAGGGFRRELARGLRNG